MKFKEVVVDCHAESTEKLIKIFDSVQTQQQYDVANRVYDMWLKSTAGLNRDIRDVYRNRIQRASLCAWRNIETIELTGTPRYQFSPIF